MTLQMFKKKFPMTVAVSQTIIDKARVSDPIKCIGALALIKGMGGVTQACKYLNMGSIWGRVSGIHTVCGEKFVIMSYDADGKPTDMMRIKKPCNVTFKLFKYSEIFA